MHQNQISPTPKWASIGGLEFGLMDYRPSPLDDTMTKLNSVSMGLWINLQYCGELVSWTIKISVGKVVVTYRTYQSTL